MSDFQVGFFEGGKGSTEGKQFGFARAPPGVGLRVVLQVAGPAEAGHCLGLVDAGATGRPGVPAAPVGVDDEPRRGLAQAGLHGRETPGAARIPKRFVHSRMFMRL